jgi:hypothetical protein
MKEIKLTKGQVTQVDDEDLIEVSIEQPADNDKQPITDKVEDWLTIKEKKDESS